MSSKLNFAQRLLISRGYSVTVGKRQKAGWSGALMFYAFKCDKHGIVENYEHGYRGRLPCPKCQEEEN